MKYLTTGIVFAEVPDEITLELGITNCPYKCEGCHSPFLQEDAGTTLTRDELKSLIGNANGITCVLFSGGDANYYEVETLCNYVKEAFPNLKTAWYSGRRVIPKDLNLRYFDYIKIGPYKKELGGLTEPTTNQRLYKIVNNQPINITQKFWK